MTRDCQENVPINGASLPHVIVNEVKDMAAKAQSVDTATVQPDVSLRST